MVDGSLGKLEEFLVSWRWVVDGRVEGAPNEMYSLGY